MENNVAPAGASGFFFVSLLYHYVASMKLFINKPLLSQIICLSQRFGQTCQSPMLRRLKGGKNKVWAALCKIQESIVTDFCIKMRIVKHRRNGMKIKLIIFSVYSAVPQGTLRLTQLI